MATVQLPLRSVVVSASWVLEQVVEGSSSSWIFWSKADDWPVEGA